jgi:hypothetical protein
MLLFSSGLGAVLGLFFPGWRALLAVLPFSIYLGLTAVSAFPSESWIAIVGWFVGNLTLFEAAFLLGCFAHVKLATMFGTRTGLARVGGLQQPRRIS